MNNESRISLLFVLVLLGFFIVPIWLQHRRKKRARSWPAIEGRVDSTSIRVESSGNNQSAVFARVLYSYYAADNSHSGVHQRRFLLWKRAEKWAAQYPEGTRVTIRVNPANPGDSLFDEQDQERNVEHEAIRT